ncbi:glycine cleavage system protein GcvH [Acidaminobacter sp. JC074]|uniref:glycine cleavage system protein GcvH n=1 Tax=Acidaminobacter sp. JC074 TaxID=2530199 RepID=UPI001F0CF607|nr:glycine cleavage system protein GcvH [Acidaminobacter sp. JC074]MCH4888862.1 glycine cleavage system protein GcvH [Acidaminobacter sp. JC074]
MKVLENLKYTKEHEWLKVEGNTATFGITDYAQNMLGGIVYVELPDEEDELEKGENFAVIESVKAATDILAPVDGTVLEVNEDLDDEPEKMNEAPYEAWVVKIELSDVSQLDEFMDAAAYEKFCEEEA